MNTNNIKLTFNLWYTFNFLMFHSEAILENFNIENDWNGYKMLVLNEATTELQILCNALIL